MPMSRLLPAAALLGALPLAAQSFEITDFSRGDLQLNGNASAGTALALTPPDTGARGSAFTFKPERVDAFRAQFRFRISQQGGSFSDSCDGRIGGEGLAFVLQGLGPQVLGQGRSGIGYGNLENRLAIEFDNHCDRGQDERYDPLEPHVAIMTGYSATHDAGQPRPGPRTVAEPAFDDGREWTVWIDYDGTDLQLRLSATGVRPCDPFLSTRFDARQFGNGAFVGFTAANGAGYAVHEITYLAFESAVDGPLPLNETDLCFHIVNPKGFAAQNQGIYKLSQLGNAMRPRLPTGPRQPGPEDFSLRGTFGTEYQEGGKLRLVLTIPQLLTDSPATAGPMLPRLPTGPR